MVINLYSQTKNLEIAGRNARSIIPTFFFLSRGWGEGEGSQSTYIARCKNSISENLEYIIIFSLISMFYKNKKVVPQFFWLWIALFFTKYEIISQSRYNIM